MTSGIYFPLCCIFFNILIMFIYFSKKRLENIENKVYKVLLISNFVGLVLEILCYFFIRNVDAFPILSNIILRAYLFYLCFFIATFTDYNAVITFKSKYDEKIDINKFFKNILILTVVLILCEILFIAFLPMQIYNDNNVVAYTYGTAVNFVYFVAVVSICIWFFNMIFNFKNLKSKKYLPMFIFLAIGLVATIVQYIYPSILLMTSMETLVVSLMFHTIENPDVKMIEQLEMAKDAADKANSAKTDFLSNMSHEIRTPLNAIVGFSDGIEQADSLDEAKENAKDIVSASNTLLEIVNSILDISKIEAGRLEIINSDYDSRELFTSLAKLVTPKMREKALDFQVSIAEDLPKTLYGDKANLKKVVTNLLSNAYKYTDKGFVKYTVSCVNQDNVCRLIISVEDSGRGMKAENVDKLFGKFQRIDEDRNTTIEGTGLGLALTKQLLELMGGNIIVHTVFGEGSKFTVTLNQRIDNIDLKEEVVVADTIDLSGRRLLVVDDNPLNLKVATKLLERYNATVECCDSGFSCIDKINSGEKYDLILMDDMMPKMNGTETFKKLKEISNFNIPVIMLTANAITGMREKYIGEGFTDYLSKPIEKDTMIKSFNRILKNTSPVSDISSVSDTHTEEEVLSEVKEEFVVDNHTKEFLESNNIDVNHGLELLGDMELYNDTMTEFVKEMDERLPDLKTYKESSDMPNYAIIVHAIKSDCKYLGIMDLADLTYEHELKSKDNDIEYVNANYDALIEKINHYMDICKKYLGKE